MADQDQDPAAEIDHLAQQPERGFIADLWLFMSTNKKWWITPIVLVLALFAALIALGNSSAAPFIYALF